jgi:nitric oxide reductase subunit B
MMADAATGPMETLSSWWKVTALGTMAAGFAVLILLTVKAYQNAPPIPEKFVNPAGGVVFTADDIIAGQQQTLINHIIRRQKFRLCRAARATRSS